MPRGSVSSLAAMHAVWKRIRAAGGKMALSNVSDLGRDILRIARFDQLWPIYPTLDEALAAVAVQGRSMGPEASDPPAG